MSELREAVARLRKHRQKLLDAINDNRPAPDRYYSFGNDAAMVADAYLAEHDPTPIDEAWLRAVGCSFSWLSCVEWEARLPIVLDETLIIRDDETLIEVGSNYIEAALCHARGDIRRLCSALGIDLKEAGDA